MNENEKMLTAAKVLWIIELIVQILWLSTSIIHIFPNNFRILFGATNAISTVTVDPVYGILALIAVWIIARISQNAKIFYLLFIVVLTEFAWIFVEPIITNYFLNIQSLFVLHGTIRQIALAEFGRAVLIQGIPQYIVDLTVAILGLIVLSEISNLANDRRFKLSGILILIEEILSIIWSLAYFYIDNVVYKLYENTLQQPTITKISISINLISNFIILAAFIILAIAILQMRIVPGSSEATENKLANNKSIGQKEPA
jgi:hypothetical protein